MYFSWMVMGIASAVIAVRLMADRRAQRVAV
jgi:hypothetical protein